MIPGADRWIFDRATNQAGRISLRFSAASVESSSESPDKHSCSTGRVQGLVSIHACGNEDVKEKAVFIAPPVLLARRSAADIYTWWRYVLEGGDIVRVFEVRVSEKSPFFCPTHVALRTDSPILAVVDCSSIGERWLRRSEAEVPEGRLTIPNIAEVVV